MSYAVPFFLISSRTNSVASSTSIVSSMAVSFSIMAFFFSRFSCSTERCEGGCFVLLFKEIVTGRNEPFPYSIRIFLGNGTYCFPFLLQFGRSSAVVFQSVLSFRASAFSHKARFFSKIPVHAFFQGFEEFSFLLEELVTCFAEAFEYLHVHLLRGKTDGFPFILQGNDFLCLVFPRREVGELVVINGFDDFTNYGLLVEIMLLSLFQGFKVLLVTTVHSSRSCL